MILPFSQQINGKETFFDRKIQSCLINELNYDFQLLNEKYGYKVNNYKPKIHTIRKDEKNRWEVGNKIHAVYNNRQKNQFQFAPTFECKGIQKIIISVRYKHVFIDSRELSVSEMNQLAINDGFDSVEDFFAYFNTNFTCKIIHFTDFRY